MDWNLILTEVIKAILVIAIPVIAKYVTSWINAKSENIKNKTKNDNIDKYIDIATNTINSCITATNQVFVESLKCEGKFDKDAQEKAFLMTKNAVMNVLSLDLQEALSEVYGDLDAFIEQQIEATINKKGEQ